MKVRADAYDKKNGDLWEACGHLKFDAEGEADCPLLTELIRLFADGGTITIKIPGRKTYSKQIHGIK